VAQGYGWQRARVAVLTHAQHLSTNVELRSLWLC
jgi:hypothetical protein